MEVKIIGRDKRSLVFDRVIQKECQGKDGRHLANCPGLTKSKPCKKIDRASMSDSGEYDETKNAAVY